MGAIKYHRTFDLLTAIYVCIRVLHSATWECLDKYMVFHILTWHYGRNKLNNLQRRSHWQTFLYLQSLVKSNLFCSYKVNEGYLVNGVRKGCGLAFRLLLETFSLDVPPNAPVDLLILISGWERGGGTYSNIKIHVTT